MSIPLLANLKYVIGSTLVGLVVALFIYFSTEKYNEYRHNFEVSSAHYAIFKRKMKRTYLDDLKRKVYFDPYFNPLQDKTTDTRTFQLQHYFTGKKQVLKDIEFYFLHNDLAQEYAKIKLQHSRFDGSGRLAQRTIGVFLLFCLLGVVLQRFSSRKKEKNEKYTE